VTVLAAAVERFGPWLFLVASGAEIAAWFRLSRRTMLIVAIAVAVIGLVPVAGLSLTDLVYSVTGPLGAGSLVILAIGLAARLQTGLTGDRRFGLLALAVLQIVIFVPVYAFELSAAGPDVYRWGYAAWELPAGGVVLLLFAWWAEAPAIALWLGLAGLLYLADAYASRNFLDYAGDPVALLLAAVMLVRSGLPARRRRYVPMSAKTRTTSS